MNTALFFAFPVFVVMQAMFIIGMKMLFEKDMILFRVGEFLKANVSKTALKPLFLCVRCMSSFWGAATFFPTCIILFGYNPIQIIVFLFDAVILVALTYTFYKRI